MQIIDLEKIDAFLMFIKHSLSVTGALIISFGAIVAIYQFVIKIFQSSKQPVLNYDRIRLNLGRSIMLGLEFVVAADVIETTTTPDYYSVGILAILILIRTFFSYFLNQELIKLSQQEEQDHP